VSPDYTSEVIRVPREPRRQNRVRTKRAAKPESLTYGADDVPPLRDVVLGGVQQSLLIIVSLIVPLLIGREAHLSPDDLQRYLTLALVAIAIGNLLIPFRVGPIGCGYLVPVFFAGLWLSPALAAVKAGGIPLVAGMTVVAGVATIPAAWLLPRLRPYLPAEISGLVVLIIGLNVSLIGLRRALQPIIIGADPRDVLWTAGSTLGLAVALRVWGTRSLSSYSIVISMVVGSAIGVATGLTPPNVLDAITRAPTVALPNLRPFGVAFDPALALPFLVTALAAVISMAGAVTNAQKINDVAWIRPDMFAIRGATIGQGIGMMIMGLLGGFGLASSSAAVGLTGATGNASRRVALAVSAILGLAALSPLLVDVVIAIPDAVMGATWLLLGGFIIIGALEMVTSRLLDARRSIVIGLALPIGLSAELFPDFYESLPQAVKPIAGSMLALGTITALVLNAIFRIGIRRQARLVVDASGFDPTAVAAFLTRQGGIWAARREIVNRATFALVQLLELIRDHRSPRGNIDVLATFDEFNLRIEATYDGAQAELPTRRPSPREMVADDTAVERLAGFLVRQSADAVNISHDDGRTRVRLVFEH
jgi:xanthine permease XanP